MEKTLSEFEHRSSNTLQNLLQTVEECGMIDPQLKPDMALFMALQYLRTPQARNLQIELAEGLMQRVLDLHIAHERPELSDHDLRARLGPDSGPLLHAQLMFSPELLTPVASVLEKHIWVVGLNNTSKPLYTSDTPLVLQPHKAKGLLPCTGLASKGIEIAFPLTPDYILILWERTSFRDLARKDCATIELDGNDVSHFNSLQVFQSYRQVYSSRSDFALAKEICGPEGRNLEPDGMTP